LKKKLLFLDFITKTKVVKKENSNYELWFTAAVLGSCLKKMVDINEDESHETV
jgi:hypothetical protein